MRLKNKVAVITGGSRGIGYATADAFLREGATVIIAASTKASADKAVTSLREKHPGAVVAGISPDLSSLESVRKEFREATSKYGCVDILVNNAGTILRKPIAEHPDEYWDEVIAVNQTAPFILAREIGKEMLKREQGKIIFTASLLSFQGGITVPGYAASKGAVAQLTKAFANEWAAKGVNVNAIVPGYISTDNTTALRADENRSRSILERIPANRWGEPEDFKGPIVFLSSKASDYVHGTLLTVDGGWMGR